MTRFPVRTDLGSLLSAGVMAGLYLLANIRFTYSDYPARRIPSVLDYGFDQMLGYVLIGAVFFLIPFVIAHVLLHAVGIGRRGWYMAAGALSALIAFLAHGGLDTLERGADQSQAAMLAIPLGVGMALGFVYHASAGRVRPQQRDLLARALGKRQDPRDLRAPGHAEAVVEHEGAAYFSGPLEVRNSLPAVLIASLFGAAVWPLLWLPAVALGWDWAFKFSFPFPAGAVPNGLELIGYLVMAGMVVLPVPVFLAHKIAVGLKQTSVAAYAAIGLATPIGIGLCLFIVGAFFLWPWSLPCALAAAAYRQLAGIGPAALPEDIIVDDRALLVNADHVTRTHARVVEG